MMSGLLRAGFGLGGAALWLLLLEATDFNTAAIGLGLLVVVAMI